MKLKVAIILNLLLISNFISCANPKPEKGVFDKCFDSGWDFGKCVGAGALYGGAVIFTAGAAAGAGVAWVEGATIGGIVEGAGVIGSASVIVAAAEVAIPVATAITAAAPVIQFSAKTIAEVAALKLVDKAYDEYSGKADERRAEKQAEQNKHYESVQKFDYKNMRDEVEDRRKAEEMSEARGKEDAKERRHREMTAALNGEEKE
jgi:uncharacterized membrane protein YhiD involved in acid resistance